MQLRRMLVLCSRCVMEAVCAARQVAPFRKLRKEKSEQGRGRITDFIKYDIRQMHTAFTGTIPFSREEEDVLVRLPSPPRAGSCGSAPPALARDSVSRHNCH